MHTKTPSNVQSSGTIAALVLTLGFSLSAASCTGAGDANEAEPTETWTVRPRHPEDPYSFYTPDDEPDSCPLAGKQARALEDTIVFEDDFLENEVDPERWNVASGYVGFASSLNTSSPANASVRDGSLVLASDRNAADDSHPYVSASVDTRDKFARTYGRIEFRGRFAKTPGVWYALVGRPWKGSYPILRIEVVNRATADHTQVYLTHEWADEAVPDADRRQSALVEGPDFAEPHVYTIVWTPETIEWLIDGESKMRSTDHGVTAAPSYWTMGAWVGGWPGEPPADAKWPTSFEIDYFRISRTGGVIGEPELVVANPKDRYFRDESLEFQLANFDEACTHIDVYEGEWRLAKRTTAPLRLPLQKISHGEHTFTFVATDGDRTARTSFTFNVN
jgi:beta-glucanase (GH16 family)